MKPRYIEASAETDREPSVHNLRKEAQARSIQMWRLPQTSNLEPNMHWAANLATQTTSCVMTDQYEMQFLVDVV
jgi:hypothetical protein